jgi:hypothetical protein
MQLALMICLAVVWLTVDWPAGLLVFFLGGYAGWAALHVGGVEGRPALRIEPTFP